MNVLKYHVMLKWEPDDEVYTVWVPTLPGCVTFGKTTEEALWMVRDAIKGYVGHLLPMVKKCPRIILSSKKPLK